MSLVKIASKEPWKSHPIASSIGVAGGIAGAAGLAHQMSDASKDKLSWKSTGSKLQLASLVTLLGTLGYVRHQLGKKNK